MPHRTGGRQRARARPCLSSTRDRLADLPRPCPPRRRRPRGRGRPAGRRTGRPRRRAAPQGPARPAGRRRRARHHRCRRRGPPAARHRADRHGARAHGRRARGHDHPRDAAPCRGCRDARARRHRERRSRAARPTTPSRSPPSPRAPCSARTPTRATAPPRPPSRRPSRTIQIVTAHPRDRATLAAVARAEVVAAAVHGTRDLVNAAPNDLYPAAFADAGEGRRQGLGRQGPARSPCSTTRRSPPAATAA